jgi:hypothetical protein
MKHKLSANKLNNVKEMYKLLETFKIPRLNHKKIRSKNRSIRSEGN